MGKSPNGRADAEHLVSHNSALPRSIHSWLERISSTKISDTANSLLSYVVFRIEDSRINPGSVSRNNLLIVSFGILFIVGLISMSKPLLERYFFSSDTFWINSGNHTLLEAFGAVISIIIGVILSWEYSASGKKHILFLVLSFFSLGVLDLFHAFSDCCHNLFVWYHSSGALLGAFFFFCATFTRGNKWQVQSKSAWKRQGHVLLGFAAICLFALGSLIWYEKIPDVLDVHLAHHTPVVEARGYFSTFIYSLNVISCFLFLYAGLSFVKGFLKTNDVLFLIFGSSALLFFESELSFAFSKLWDPMWWYWHVIKAFVFSGLLIGLAFGFTRTFYGLHTSRMKLAKLVQDVEEKNIEIKRAYERLKETQGYLNESEKLASLGKMAAVLAHEIKNPLGAITNSLGVLSRYGITGQDDHELVGIVESEIERLNKLVEDFLDFSRPSSLHLVKTDLHLIIEETLSLLSMDRKIIEGIQVVKELESGVPQILLDRNHMKQVLLNLLLNAIQAMPRGGILTIRTHYSITSGEVELNVADTGIGMSEEVLGQVFQPFFTTKDKGLGLGLNIVHKTVKAHGGYVLISSKEGKGTEVQLNFPVTPQDYNTNLDGESVVRTEFEDDNGNNGENTGN